jgi:hypothetical protein
MQYAIHIILPNEEKLVTIREMQQKGEEARSYEYECPDDYCRVKVYPTFPEREKSGRKEAHRPYFSARGKSHENFCQRDSVYALMDKLTTRVRRMKLLPEAEALLARYPQRFDESPHTDRLEKNDNASVSEASPIKENGETKCSNSDQASTFQRESTRGSRFLEEFVKVYEAFPKLRRQLPIRIRFCPAKTYEEAFMDVTDAVDEQGIAGARHIYFGSYQRKVEYPGGTAVYLEGSSGDGKPLGIWIPVGVGSRTQQIKDTIFERLEKTQNEPTDNRTSKIYAIGTFEAFYSVSESDQQEVWKYSLNVTHLNQLWISFPDDLAQQP